MSSPPKSEQTFSETTKLIYILISSTLFSFRPLLVNLSLSFDKSGGPERNETTGQSDENVGEDEEVSSELGVAS